MSKRRRYKPEEKLAAVLEYVNGNKSYTEAGKVVGVDSWTVRDWVFRYKLEGAEAFFSKGKNKQYPEELRKAAVMDYQAGTGSLREICSKYKIREKTQLRMWIEMVLPCTLTVSQTGCETSAGSMIFLTSIPTPSGIQQPRP